MRALTISAIALSMLGLATSAHAQTGGTKLFFEGDMVRGNQTGAPGPGCVLNGQFKHLEKVVWRVRVLDQDGKALDDKGVKSLVVMLPDGQKLEGRFGPHPPRDTTDHFWTAVWIVPENYPNGTLVYKVTATDLQGQTHTWEPFKRVVSQLAVIDGKIELK